VRIGARRAGASACILVSDDGPGIPEEARDLIFEPYRQAHKERGVTASIGIGLTVSRRLARLMGGDLVYRFENGESTFELALPGARRRERTPKAAGELAANDSLGPGASGGKPVPAVLPGFAIAGIRAEGAGVGAMGEAGITSHDRRADSRADLPVARAVVLEAPRAEDRG